MDAATSSAVSALMAQSAALSTVSTNLANTDTTGYKSVSTVFSSLLTQDGLGNTVDRGGVKASIRQNVLAQGVVTSSTTSTDMAINGNGMFAVKDGLAGTGTYYTRDGAFSTDAAGNLMVTGTNYYLQGWPTDSNGNVVASTPGSASSLTTVNIDPNGVGASATSSYSLSANLPAGQTVATGASLASLPYTNAAGTSENVTVGYSLDGTSAATSTSDGTATYIVTVNAPPGQTISDGTTATASGNSQFSSLAYAVTVDTSGANNGQILGYQGITPGAATQYQSGTTSNAAGNAVSASATFPSVTPSDGTGAISLPSSWTGGTTPTWTQVTGTLGSAPTGFAQTTTMAVYDSLGTEQTFPVTWTALGNDNWTMTVGTPTDPTGATPSGQLVDSTGAPVSSYSYAVSFNTDGALSSITAMPTATGTAPMSSTGQPELTATWTDGAAASKIAVNLGTPGSTSGLSQFDTGQSTPSVTVSTSSKNGAAAGALTGVSVNQDGDVVASYTNGETIPIYKIPVVTFPNENGLTAMTDNVYAQSSQSGTYTLNAAGTNGAGSVEGSSVESSTVQTDTQFTNMIVAQQAYSAASQVISGTNQMYSTLISMYQ